MKKSLYSVFDSTAQAHGNPFTSINHGTAFRDFSHACQDPNSVLAKSPQEFALFHLADFDDNTGEIIPVTPRRVCGADEIQSHLQEK